MTMSSRSRALALLLVASASLAACSPAEETARTAAPPAQPIRVETVSLRPMRASASYTGVIRPRFESDIGFRVGGKIVERLVDVGDIVAPGQPVARLDETDLALSAQASKAEVEAARSSLTQIAAEVERTTMLFKKRFVAKAALDRAQSAKAEALARLERAENALSLAENQRGYAVLTADRAAVVSSLGAEVGQVVSAGQPVARLARMDALDAVIAIPEQKRDHLGGDASAEVWGLPGRAFPVTLREIAPDVDAASRTYEARFAFSSADAALAFGRTVTLRVRELDAPNVAEVPLSAVLNEGDGPTVFVLSADGASVTPRRVEMISLSNESAMLRDGVKEGERIVTLGLHKLDASKPVRVVEDQSQITRR